jgi:CheY-like chemotaxis protein
MQSRIFEPFFTTKEYGKGTGLGLSTAHGIITQSGGYITVRSDAGTGATFTVYLPLVQSAPAVNVATAPVSSVTRGAETILLVEDDDAVRTTATRILERAGYTIYAAADGGEALAIHDRIGHGIDLLLTDMIMPEMSGGELTARIREREPNVAVLVMSGYTEQTSLRQRLVDSGSAFIQKPFTPESLTRKVREALNATAAVQAS